jgi:hypothetical protein
MTRIVAAIWLLVLVAAGSETAAQRTPKFRGIVGLGVSTPTGDANQLWNMGFHGLAGVGFQLTPITQFVPKIEYHGMPLDKMGLLDISGGTLHVLMIGADIIATADVPESDVKPQFLVGFGMGHASISDIYESGQPVLRFESETKLYYDIGVGLEAKAGGRATGFFFIRFVSIKTEGTVISFVPITLGATFF